MVVTSTGNLTVGPTPGRVLEGGAVVGLIIGLLVLWLILTVVGFVIKSLFWLAIVGIVLFIATGVFGAVRRRSTLR
jgi:hypothetical protein